MTTQNLDGTLTDVQLDAALAALWFVALTMDSARRNLTRILGQLFDLFQFGQVSTNDRFGNGLGRQGVA